MEKLIVDHAMDKQKVKSWLGARMEQRCSTCKHTVHSS
jgi:hypothetical protein